MMTQTSFASVAELDRVYSEHLDSLVNGGFISSDATSPERLAYVATWAEAVANLEEELSKPRDFTSL